MDQFAFEYITTAPQVSPDPDFEWLPFCQYMRVFTAAECKRIILQGRDAGMSPAVVIDSTTGLDDTDDESRVSDIGWLDYRNVAQYGWIMERLGGYARDAATTLGIDIVGFEEHLQVARYGPGGHYAEHQDGPGRGGTHRRKLSVVVQLSKASEYTGGHLQVMEDVADRAIGSATFFASFLNHTAQPVTRGERWSLVSWIGGPPFR